MRKSTLAITLAILFTTGCNPLSRLGEAAVKQNHENVEYLGEQLNQYLDEDTEADKDVVKAKKLAIRKAADLARQMEDQFE